MCFDRGSSYMCATMWSDDTHMPAREVRHEGPGPLPRNWMAFFEAWKP
jgi:hypothetical protein